jgi:sugar (pentulose or hexulose) kinase
VLVLAGGSRSTTWLQLRADVLDLPHHVASRTDTAAIGAAMIAAVAVGALADLPAACALAPPSAATFRPRTARDEAYDEAYTRYRELVAQLV